MDYLEVVKQSIGSDFIDLLPINTDDEENLTVSGRDLHEALKIRTTYRDWFPRMCSYGFIENEDFNTLKNERVQIEGKRVVSRTVTDHRISIDMAKEICMIQRSDIGRKFRLYFIRVEEAWRNSIIQNLKNQAIFANQISVSADTISVGELAKLLNKNGIDIGRDRLFKWLRANGFLTTTGKHRNIPTQKAVNLGVLTLNETSYVKKDGTHGIGFTPRVTVKGQQYFMSRFLRENVSV